MSYKVLITTSGIGSRLGDLTDYTNKALVKVGDKPAIAHIIESYPSDTQFVITLGHYGEYVKEFVTIAYPNIGAEFVEVDPYEGPNSSLGYSILQAYENLQCPFIFNACDTLFADPSLLYKCAQRPVQNFCIGDRKEDTTQYSTLLVERNKVMHIKEKGEINYDFAYVGICGIKDYSLFWKHLGKIYAENPNNSGLFDGNVINRMLPEVDFAFVEHRGWLDVGNVRELEKTRQLFSATANVLEKKGESIYFFSDHVIKFFADPEVNKNRVHRAEYLRGLVPRVVTAGNNFYKYEKAVGKLFSQSVTRSKFSNFLEWAKQNLWIKKECHKFNEICYRFYVDKTFSRIEAFLDKNADSLDLINGEEILPIKELFSKIDLEWLCAGAPSQFHGDFILDNVLETESGFCLLDWRQDFGGNLSTGDVYYDLAKLNHNLIINHEIANKKMFNSSGDNCYILCNSKLLECQKVLRQFIIDNGYDFKKVQVLTAIIWINMAPLHKYPFNKFLFNFGKLNLKRALEDVD